MKQNPRDQPHTQREGEKRHIKHLHTFQIQDRSLDSAPPPPLPSPPNNRSHIISSRLTAPYPLHPQSSILLRISHNSHLTLHPHPTTPTHTSLLPARPARAPAPRLTSPRRIPPRHARHPESEPDKHPRRPDIPNTPPPPRNTQPPRPTPPSPRKKKPGPGEKKESLLIPCAATRTPQPHGRGGGDRC